MIVGCGTTIIVNGFGLQKTLLKFGETRVLTIVLLFGIIVSALRCFPSPYYPIAPIIISCVANQLVLTFVDPPYITFASMYAVPQNRAKLLGVF